MPRPGWLAVLLPHLADPRLGAVAPRITALPGAPGGWMHAWEAAGGALDMGPRPAPVRPLSAVPYVPSAALLVRRAALGSGFDEAMRVAEDDDLVWRLAARHGSLVSPPVLAPSSALAWALAVAGGRRSPMVAAGIAADAVRLARRLGPPASPAVAAGLVAHGSAASGRAPARSVTRHHWPLALAVATASRRARRWIAGAVAADAVLAWWPHRERVGPVRFAAGRRLEDLAYGAGLWVGAVRERQPLALLPARPPR